MNEMLKELINQFIWQNGPGDMTLDEAEAIATDLFLKLHREPARAEHPKPETCALCEQTWPASDPTNYISGVLLHKPSVGIGDLPQMSSTNPWNSLEDQPCEICGRTTPCQHRNDAAGVRPEETEVAFSDFSARRHGQDTVCHVDLTLRD